MYIYIFLFFRGKYQVSETYHTMVWRRNIFNSSIEERDTKNHPEKVSPCELHLVKLYIVTFFRSEPCKFEVRLILEKKFKYISEDIERLETIRN